MNSKIGGPGWDRTNDQPIMSPERRRPTRSSDVDPSTKRRRPRPTNPPSSVEIHPIGSQDWQSTLSTVGGRFVTVPLSIASRTASSASRTATALGASSAHSHLSGRDSGCVRPVQPARVRLTTVSEVVASHREISATTLMLSPGSILPSNGPRSLQAAVEVRPVGTIGICTWHAAIVVIKPAGVVTLKLK